MTSRRSEPPSNDDPISAATGPWNPANARNAGPVTLASSWGNKFPRDSAMLRRRLEAQGLRPVSGWYSARHLEHSVEGTGLR